MLEKKIDRYIRPVYRQNDVEEYFNNTRATVSHKSSSNAIIEASQELNEKAEVLSKNIEAQQKRTLIESKNLINSMNIRLQEKLHLETNKIALNLKQMELQLSLNLAKKEFALKNIIADELQKQLKDIYKTKAIELH